MCRCLKMFFILILTGVLVSACGSSKLKYVVYRDVPQRPAFTVVPVSYSAADYRFKENTESALIEMGLAVIETPLKNKFKTKPESNALTAKRDMQLHDAVKSVSIDDFIETAEVYEQSKADYVILLNAQTNVLKITRQTTREIQAVIKYSVMDQSGSRFIKLHETLLNLGFKVKAVSKKEKLKMEYPLKEKGLMRY